MRTDIDGAGRIFDNPDETMPFFDRQRDQILFVAGFHAERIGEADATQLAVIGERPAMIWAGEATALAAFLRNQPRAAMAADIPIDRKSTRLNSSPQCASRLQSSSE